MSERITPEPRRSRRPQSVQYELVAELAMQMATTNHGRFIFAPAPKDVIPKLDLTNGSVLRFLHYAEILEGETGLTVVHNGLVLQELDVVSNNEAHKSN
ncbi:MAG TPA: hypothetical protein VMR28_02145 [Candidatus Saccharimonadales bacterium]|nr:hypothetical protein [Candidatus Saccharimonadales bacterium]